MTTQVPTVVLDADDAVAIASYGLPWFVRDLDGDGIDEVMAIEHDEDLAPVTHYSLLVFSGATRGVEPFPMLMVMPEYYSSDFIFQDRTPWNEDITGDGLAELFGNGQTGAHLIDGASRGTFDLASTSSFSIPDAFFVSPAGDMDGDGLVDLLITSMVRPRDREYTARVVSAADIGTGVVSQVDLPPLLLMVTFGNQVWDAGGDWDGDGTRDLAVGMVWNPTGDICIVSGATRGEGDVTDLAIDTFVGPSFENWSDKIVEGLGQAVDMTGDVNGDGMPDLLASASGAGTHTMQYPGGRVYLTTGEFSRGQGAVWPMEEVSQLIIEPDQVHLGYAVSFGGDYDGDGGAEILVGSWEKGALFRSSRTGVQYQSNADVLFDLPWTVSIDVGNADNDGVPDVIIDAGYHLVLGDTLMGMLAP